MDTVPGNRPTDKINTQSTISRFACRILSNREEEDLNAMIFAGRHFFRKLNKFDTYVFVYTINKFENATIFQNYTVRHSIFVTVT